jgi:hypothetical protein
MKQDTIFLAIMFGLILIVGFIAVFSIDGKLSEIIKILKGKKGE